MEPADLATTVAHLYRAFGQRKPMGSVSPSAELPQYFLHRSFLGQQDLLVILNTKRCRHQCNFCQLPLKSSRKFIPHTKILKQFAHVVQELKHSLSVIERVTLSNEGSVLDSATLPTLALEGILLAVNELKVVRTVVFETRMEYIDEVKLSVLQNHLTRAQINILTGFETVDERIRNKVLKKREPLHTFTTGLDAVAATTKSLTAYVLFKPAPTMTDSDAVIEADATIRYLLRECTNRGVDLTVRLNPMYKAAGSPWAVLADSTPTYSPPRLSDVMTVADRWRAQGLKIYIGLSTEGLDDPSGTYSSREDYRPEFVKLIKLFNDQRIVSFPKL